MPGDIYPAHVLWMLYLICYALSINHFLCCVPVHKCSENTREAAPCVPTEGAAQLQLHTELLHGSCHGYNLPSLTQFQAIPLGLVVLPCPSLKPAMPPAPMWAMYLPTTSSPSAAPIPPNLFFTQDSSSKLPLHQHKSSGPAAPTDHLWKPQRGHSHVCCSLCH